MMPMLTPSHADPHWLHRRSESVFRYSRGLQGVESHGAPAHLSALPSYWSVSLRSCPCGNAFLMPPAFRRLLHASVALVMSFVPRVLSARRASECLLRSCVDLGAFGLTGLTRSCQLAASPGRSFDTRLNEIHASFSSAQERPAVTLISGFVLVLPCS